MKQVPIFNYYWFGTCVRYLTDAKSGVFIKKEGYILDNINSFFGYLDDLGLQVTRRAAIDLKKMEIELETLADDAVMTKEQINELNSVMVSLRKTLDAELKGFFVYMIYPKRLDTTKLLEDVSALFTPNVYIELPEIAQRDFAEAGKCIAFSQPTAAAFHILRGTEGVVKYFYFSMIKQKRIKSPFMWGPMVADLRGKTKSKGYVTLYNHLDHIRKSFRNPTQHPELFYDIHEVQDLWSLCVEVSCRMIKTINEH